MDETDDGAPQLPGQAPVRLPGRDLLVLYGSEMGNSQDLAEDLGQCAERLHFSTTVQEMNETDLVRPVSSSTATDALRPFWCPCFTAFARVMKLTRLAPSRCANYGILIFAAHTVGSWAGHFCHLDHRSG